MPDFRRIKKVSVARSWPRCRLHLRHGGTYEAPHRLTATLAGHQHHTAVRGGGCPELTKLYEELLPGTTAQVRELVQDGRERGEIVILIAPADENSVMQDGLSAEEQLAASLAKGHTVKEAAALVAAAITPCRELYARALLLWGKKVH